MEFEQVPDYLVKKHSEKLDRIEEGIYDGGEKTREQRMEHHVKFHLAARNIPTDFINTIWSDHEKFDRTCKEYDLSENKTTGEKIELYEDFLHDYIENIDKVMDTGASLFFFGPNESGKTFSALHTLSYAIERGYSGYYINFQDLYKLYNKSSYDSEADESSKIYSYVKNCDMLVIDELGKESSVTDGIIGFLESIIKYRGTEVLPTIFCSNIKVNENDFYERYGNSPLNAMIKRYKVFQFSKEGKFRQRFQIDWEQINGS